MMAKEMVIEKHVTIEQDLDTVFAFLQEIKNQDHYNIWVMKDPTMKKTYSGTDGTVGFKYSWDSNDKGVGAGSQEITRISPGKLIEYDIKFLRPMKNVAVAYFTTSKVNEGSTSVTWTYKSPTKFPLSLFAPFLKKMLGKQLQQSLDNLKSLLEKDR